MYQPRDAEIVILGGGYAGHMAAVRAARAAPHAHITLVDGRAEFTERIRLHQRLAGSHGAERSRSKKLPPGVDFFHGWVGHIDPASKTATIVTAGGDAQIQWDVMVYALGSTTDDLGVPGVEEHAHTLDDLFEGDDLVNRLREASERGGRWWIVGGGLSGVEIASELAEAYAGSALKLGLVCGERLAPAQSERAADHIRHWLLGRGVDVREGERVMAVTAGALDLHGGEQLKGDGVLWAAGHRANPVARDAGLPVDGLGRVCVGPTLQVVGHPDMLAVGDGARIELDGGVVLEMSCAAAMPAGAHAGRNAAALIGGKGAMPFQYGGVLRCISLGRNDGVVERLNGDSTATGQLLTGRMAAWVKELICRMAGGAPDWESTLRLPIYYWPTSNTAALALPEPAPGS